MSASVLTIAWDLGESARQEVATAVCRAEVADVADVVRQRADALMLSGESAIGAFPDKALGVLRAVATSSEEWGR